MKALSLDAEEQELLDAFDAGEFKSVMTPARKQFIETVAKQSFQRNYSAYKKSVILTK
jgi:hypothetical protein